MRKVLSTTLCVLLATAAAQGRAGITTEFVQIDTATIESVTYNIWEMRVTTGADWTNTRLDITLDTGQMFNVDAFIVEQPDAVKAGTPNLAYDTWVTVPEGAGAPVAIGGTPVQGPTEFGVSWGNLNTTDIGTFDIAQITLSADAAGTLSARNFQAGAPEDVYGAHAVIRNGMIVPEPASAFVLLLGVGTTVLIRRPRQAVVLYN